MRILLDGNRCDAKAASVAEAIGAGMIAAQSAGRRLVEVVVDGATLSPQDLHSPACLDRAAGEVRLVSADPGLMVRETFMQAADALREIDSMQRLAAEMLQSGDVAAAMETLDGAISSWMLVQDAVLKGSRFAGIDLERATWGDLRAGDVVTRLNRHLTSMAAALRRRDHIALSDTLLYEMPDLVASWKAVMERLARGA